MTLATEQARTATNTFRAVSPDEVAAEERWREWQSRNAIASRRSAWQVRLLFTAVFAVTGLWLGLLLLAQ
jgi:hypothetical protein